MIYCEFSKATNAKRVRLSVCSEITFLICQTECTNRISKVAGIRRNQIGSNLFLRQEKQFFHYSVRSNSVQSRKGQHRSSHELDIVDIQGPKDGNLDAKLKHVSIGNVYKLYGKGKYNFNVKNMPATPSFFFLINKQPTQR
jgi:hypothetical protein